MTLIEVNCKEIRSCYYLLNFNGHIRFIREGKISECFERKSGIVPFLFFLFLQIGSFSLLFWLFGLLDGNGFWIITKLQERILCFLCLSVTETLILITIWITKVLFPGRRFFVGFYFDYGLIMAHTSSGNSLAAVINLDIGVSVHHWWQRWWCWGWLWLWLAERWKCSVSTLRGARDQQIYGPP